MSLVDFEMLADSVDIKEILEELNLRIYSFNSDSIKIECPNPLHVDAHPSCFFHPESMIWHCFGCHNKGTIIDIVENYKDISRDEAKEYLNGLLGTVSNISCEKYKERFNENDMPTFQLSSMYRRDFENAGHDILDFIRRRRFNLLLFDRYGIGYNRTLNSLTLPVVYKNKIINIGERFIDPKDIKREGTKIKYKSDTPLSKCVWGVFENYNNVDPFFTEGIFDAIRMREAGYNAYALLSNQLSEAKLRFLNEHFRGEWTIVPDNDDGGIAMITAWKRQLHNSDVMIVDIRGYKDVDEMPLNDIHSVVRSRRSLMESLIKEVVVKDSEINEFDDR